MYATETLDLPEPCRVLLYTDGLTEAPDAHGERFGQERLTCWLKGATSRTAGELKDELARKLAQFQSKTGLNDDRTFLIITG